MTLAPTYTRRHRAGVTSGICPGSGMKPMEAPGRHSPLRRTARMQALGRGWRDQPPKSPEERTNAWPTRPALI